MKMLADPELPEELRALNAARKRAYDADQDVAQAKLGEIALTPTIDEQILNELQTITYILHELLAGQKNNG